MWQFTRGYQRATDHQRKLRRRYFEFKTLLENPLQIPLISEDTLKLIGLIIIPFKLGYPSIIKHCNGKSPKTWRFSAWKLYKGTILSMLRHATSDDQRIVHFGDSSMVFFRIVCAKLGRVNGVILWGFFKVDIRLRVTVRFQPHRFSGSRPLKSIEIKPY